MFLQRASCSEFSLIIRSIGLVFVIASVIISCSNTQDFLFGILAALIHQGREIDLNLRVNFCFWWLFVWLTKPLLWPPASLFHESCWLTLSWRLSFLSFWLLLPKLSLLLLIVKSIFKHISFCRVFIHCVVSICKSVCCLFFNHKFQCCWEHFWKDFFGVALKKTFLKNLVLLYWTLFSFGFLLVNESALCLSLNLFLVFRWNEW